MRRYFTASLLAASLLLAAGCAPTVETRGNLVSDVKYAQVKPFSSTRADVEQSWGPPTTVSTLDPNTWYYIGETTAQEGIFAHEVIERRMIRVRFSDTDTVTSIEEIDPKLAQNVDPVERKTPTAGREYTMFQQFVGNLGRFNKDPKAKK